MVKHYDEGKYLEDFWDTGKFRKLDTVLRDFLQLQQANVLLLLTWLVCISAKILHLIILLLYMRITSISIYSVYQLYRDRQIKEQIRCLLV